MLNKYESSEAGKIRKAEEKIDKYEDMLGTYLVKLSSYQISDEDSAEVSKLLKVMGDIERISDHGVNILESAEELASKDIKFTSVAREELDVMCGAVSEILTMSYMALVERDMESVRNVEPLEQVIDGLKEKLRDGHISRLKRGECSIEAGFIWAELITNLERTADHCSNIAVCVMDAAENNMNIHESLRKMKKGNAYFDEKYAAYAGKYMLLD